MKNKISLLFLIIFAFNLYGQQFNSINYSNGLPYSFRLYVPDSTTQILFNPARAANSDQSFFYLTKNQEPTYYPVYLVSSYNDGYYELVRLSSPNYVSNYPQYNSSFSGGALFNSSYGKFLFQANFELRDSDSESESNSFNPTVNLSSDYYSEKNSNTSDANQNLSNLYFRIDKISGTEGDGFSIGLFGQIAPNKYNSNSGSTRERIQKYNYTPAIPGYYYRNYQFQKNNNKSDSDGGFYNGGIEIGISKEDFDLIADVSVTLSKNIISNNSNYFTSNMDSSYNTPNWQVGKNIQRNVNENDEKEDLIGFRSNIHYSSAANYFHQDDSYFIGLSFSYQSGDHKIKGNLLSEYASKYSWSETWNGDSTYYRLPDESSPTKNTFYGFQTGYKTGKTFDDIIVLTGLTYIFGFTKSEHISYSFNVSNYSGYINKNDFENHFYLNTFLLPVFISYSPNSWFELHGGLTYEINQQSLETENKQTQKNFENNNVVKNTSNGKFQNKSSQTSQNLNSSLGATFKHTSGLKLYIAFNNDILAYKTWDLTLLYNF